MLASSQHRFFHMALSSGLCKDKGFQEENPSLNSAILHVVAADCIVIHLISLPILSSNRQYLITQTNSRKPENGGENPILTGYFVIYFYMTNTKSCKSTQGISNTYHIYVCVCVYTCVKK